MKSLSPSKLTILVTGLLILMFSQADRNGSAIQKKAAITGKIELGFSYCIPQNDADIEEDYDDDKSFQPATSDLPSYGSSKFAQLKTPSTRQGFFRNISVSIFTCCFRI